MMRDFEASLDPAFWIGGWSFLNFSRTLKSRQEAIFFRAKERKSFVFGEEVSLDIFQEHSKPRGNHEEEKISRAPENPISAVLLKSPHTDEVYKSKNIMISAINTDDDEAGRLKNGEFKIDSTPFKAIIETKVCNEESSARKRNFGPPFSAVYEGTFKRRKGVGNVGVRVNNSTPSNEAPPVYASSSSSRKFEKSPDSTHPVPAFLKGEFEGRRCPLKNSSTGNCSSLKRKEYQLVASTVKRAGNLPGLLKFYVERLYHCERLMHCMPSSRLSRSLKTGKRSGESGIAASATSSDKLGPHISFLKIVVFYHPEASVSFGYSDIIKNAFSWPRESMPKRKPLFAAQKEESSRESREGKLKGESTHTSSAGGGFHASFPSPTPENKSEIFLSSHGSNEEEHHRPAQLKKSTFRWVISRSLLRNSWELHFPVFTESLRLPRECRPPLYVWQESCLLSSWYLAQEIRSAILEGFNVKIYSFPHLKGGGLEVCVSYCLILDKWIIDCNGITVVNGEEEGASVVFSQKEEGVEEVEFAMEQWKMFVRQLEDSKVKVLKKVLSFNSLQGFLMMKFCYLQRSSSFNKNINKEAKNPFGKYFYPSSFCFYALIPNFFSEYPIRCWDPSVAFSFFQCVGLPAFEGISSAILYTIEDVQNFFLKRKEEAVFRYPERDGISDRDPFNLGVTFFVVAVIPIGLSDSRKKEGFSELSSTKKYKQVAFSIKKEVFNGNIAVLKEADEVDEDDGCGGVFYVARNAKEIGSSKVSTCDFMPNYTRGITRAYTALEDASCGCSSFASSFVSSSSSFVSSSSSASSSFASSSSSGFFSSATNFSPPTPSSPPLPPSPQQPSPKSQYIEFSSTSCRISYLDEYLQALEQAKSIDEFLQCVSCIFEDSGRVLEVLSMKNMQYELIESVKDVFCKHLSSKKNLQEFVSGEELLIACQSLCVPSVMPLPSPSIYRKNGGKEGRNCLVPRGKSIEELLYGRCVLNRGEGCRYLLKEALENASFSFILGKMLDDYVGIAFHKIYNLIDSLSVLAEAKAMWSNGCCYAPSCGSFFLLLCYSSILLLRGKLMNLSKLGQCVNPYSCMHGFFESWFLLMRRHKALVEGMGGVCLAGPVSSSHQNYEDILSCVLSHPIRDFLVKSDSSLMLQDTAVKGQNSPFQSFLLRNESASDEQTSFTSTVTRNAADEAFSGQVSADEAQDCSSYLSSSSSSSTSPPLSLTLPASSSTLPSSTSSLTLPTSSLTLPTSSSIAQHQPSTHSTLTLKSKNTGRLSSEVGKSRENFQCVALKCRYEGLFDKKSFLHYVLHYQNLKKASDYSMCDSLVTRNGAVCPMCVSECMKNFIYGSIQGYSEMFFVCLLAWSFLSDVIKRMALLSLDDGGINLTSSHMGKISKLLDQNLGLFVSFISSYMSWCCRPLEQLKEQQGHPLFASSGSFIDKISKYTDESLLIVDSEATETFRDASKSSSHNDNEEEESDDAKLPFMRSIQSQKTRGLSDHLPVKHESSREALGSNRRTQVLHPDNSTECEDLENGKQAGFEYQNTYKMMFCSFHSGSQPHSREGVLNSSDSHEWSVCANSSGKSLLHEEHPRKERSLEVARGGINDVRSFCCVFDAKDEFKRSTARPKLACVFFIISPPFILDEFCVKLIQKALEKVALEQKSSGEDDASSSLIAYPFVIVNDDGAGPNSLAKSPEKIDSVIFSHLLEGRSCVFVSHSPAFALSVSRQLQQRVLKEKEEEKKSFLREKKHTHEDRHQDYTEETRMEGRIPSSRYYESFSYYFYCWKEELKTSELSSGATLVDCSNFRSRRKLEEEKKNDSHLVGGLSGFSVSEKSKRRNVSTVESKEASDKFGVESSREEGEIRFSAYDLDSVWTINERENRRKVGEFDENSNDSVIKSKKREEFAQNSSSDASWSSKRTSKFPLDEVLGTSKKEGVCGLDWRNPKKDETPANVRTKDRGKRHENHVEEDLQFKSGDFLNTHSFSVSLEDHQRVNSNFSAVEDNTRENAGFFLLLDENYYRESARFPRICCIFCVWDYSLEACSSALKISHSLYKAVNAAGRKVSLHAQSSVLSMRKELRMSNSRESSEILTYLKRHANNNSLQKTDKHQFIPHAQTSTHSTYRGIDSLHQFTSYTQKSAQNPRFRDESDYSGLAGVHAEKPFVTKETAFYFDQPGKWHFLLRKWRAEVDEMFKDEDEAGEICQGKLLKGIMCGGTEKSDEASFFDALNDSFWSCIKLRSNSTLYSTVELVASPKDKEAKPEFFFVFATIRQKSLSKLLGRRHKAKSLVKFENSSSVCAKREVLRDRLGAAISDLQEQNSSLSCAEDQNLLECGYPTLLQLEGNFMKDFVHGIYECFKFIEGECSSEVRMISYERKLAGDYARVRERKGSSDVPSQPLDAEDQSPVSMGKEPRIHSEKLASNFEDLVKKNADSFSPSSSTLSSSSSSSSLTFCAFSFSPPSSSSYFSSSSSFCAPAHPSPSFSSSCSTADLFGPVSKHTCAKFPVHKQAKAPDSSASTTSAPIPPNTHSHTSKKAGKEEGGVRDPILGGLLSNVARTPSSFERTRHLQLSIITLIPVGIPGAGKSSMLFQIVEDVCGYRMKATDAEYTCWNAQREASNQLDVDCLHFVSSDGFTIKEKSKNLSYKGNSYAPSMTAITIGKKNFFASISRFFDELCVRTRDEYLPKLREEKTMNLFDDEAPSLSKLQRKRVLLVVDKNHPFGALKKTIDVVRSSVDTLRSKLRALNASLPYETSVTLSAPQFEKPWYPLQGSSSHSFSNFNSSFTPQYLSLQPPRKLDSHSSSHPHYSHSRSYSPSTLHPYSQPPRQSHSHSSFNHPAHSHSHSPRHPPHHSTHPHSAAATKKLEKEFSFASRPHPKKEALFSRPSHHSMSKPSHTHEVTDAPIANPKFSNKPLRSTPSLVTAKKSFIPLNIFKDSSDSPDSLESISRENSSHSLFLSASGSNLTPLVCLSASPQPPSVIAANLTVSADCESLFYVVFFPSRDNVGRASEGEDIKVCVCASSSPLPDDPTQGVGEREAYRELKREIFERLLSYACRQKESTDFQQVKKAFDSWNGLTAEAAGDSRGIPDTHWKPPSRAIRSNQQVNYTSLGNQTNIEATIGKSSRPLIVSPSSTATNTRYPWSIRTLIECIRRVHLRKEEKSLNFPKFGDSCIHLVLSFFEIYGVQEDNEEAWKVYFYGEDEEEKKDALVNAVVDAGCFETEWLSVCGKKEDGVGLGGGLGGSFYEGIPSGLNKASPTGLGGGIPPSSPPKVLTTREERAPDIAASPSTHSHLSDSPSSPVNKLLPFFEDSHIVSTIVSTAGGNEILPLTHTEKLFLFRENQLGEDDGSLSYLWKVLRKKVSLSSPHELRVKALMIEILEFLILSAMQDLVPFSELPQHNPFYGLISCFFEGWCEEDSVNGVENLAKKKVKEQALAVELCLLMKLNEREAAEQAKTEVGDAISTFPPFQNLELKLDSPVSKGYAARVTPVGRRNANKEQPHQRSSPKEAPPTSIPPWKHRKQSKYPPLLYSHKSWKNPPGTVINSAKQPSLSAVSSFADHSANLTENRPLFKAKEASSSACLGSDVKMPRCYFVDLSAFLSSVKRFSNELLPKILGAFPQSNRVEFQGRFNSVHVSPERREGGDASLSYLWMKSLSCTTIDPSSYPRSRASHLRGGSPGISEHPPRTSEHSPPSLDYPPIASYHPPASSYHPSSSLDHLTLLPEVPFDDAFLLKRPSSALCGVKDVCVNSLDNAINSVLKISEQLLRQRDRRQLNFKLTQIIAFEGSVIVACLQPLCNVMVLPFSEEEMSGRKNSATHTHCLAEGRSHMQNTLRQPLLPSTSQVAALRGGGREKMLRKCEAPLPECPKREEGEVDISPSLYSPQNFMLSSDSCSYPSLVTLQGFIPHTTLLKTSHTKPSYTSPASLHELYKLMKEEGIFQKYPKFCFLKMEVSADFRGGIVEGDKSSGELMGGVLEGDRGGRELMRQGNRECKSGGEPILEGSGGSPKEGAKRISQNVSLPESSPIPEPTTEAALLQERADGSVCVPPHPHSLEACSTTDFVSSPCIASGVAYSHQPALTKQTSRRFKCVDLCEDRLLLIKEANILGSLRNVAILALDDEAGEPEMVLSGELKCMQPLKGRR